MRKKAVVHIIHNLQIGGVEVAVRSSIDELNSDYDFWVISLHPNNVEFVADVKYKDRLKCFNLKSVWFIVNLVRLFYFIFKVKPVIILSSLWGAHFITLLIHIFKPQIKIISIIHSSFFFHFFDKYFVTAIVKKSTLILCDSNSSKNTIKEMASDKKIQVLSFKIDSISGTYQVNALTELKAVFIGRIHSVKRIDRSIKLVHLLRKYGVNILFDVYGPDQGEEHKLKKLIRKLSLDDVVSIKGPINPDKINNVLSNYRFLIQLSDSEGMGITVIQAMELGLIPIVTNVGEMQFYVKHMENGFLLNYPLDELEGFAKQLLPVFEDDIIANKISLNAKATFTNMPFYKEHLNSILKEIINRP